MPKTSLIPFEILVWLDQAADVGCAEPIVLRHLMRRLEALENDWAQELRASDAYNEAFVEATVRRLEALEAAQQQLHQGKLDRFKALGQDDDCSSPEPAPAADDSDLQTLHGIALDMVDTLPVLPEIKRILRRAIQEPMQQPARQPTPPVAPAATEMVATLESAPVATDDELFDLFHQHGPLGIVLRNIYNLGRQHGAVQIPATKSDLEPNPPAAPAGGLVERVATAMHPNYPRAFQGEARAAICEVAAWAREQSIFGKPEVWAERLYQEAHQ